MWTLAETKTWMEWLNRSATSVEHLCWGLKSMGSCFCCRTGESFILCRCSVDVFQRKVCHCWPKHTNFPDVHQLQGLQRNVTWVQEIIPCRLRTRVFHIVDSSDSQLHSFMRGQLFPRQTRWPAEMQCTLFYKALSKWEGCLRLYAIRRVIVSFLMFLYLFQDRPSRSCFARFEDSPQLVK